MKLPRLRRSGERSPREGTVVPASRPSDVTTTPNWGNAGGDSADPWGLRLGPWDPFQELVTLHERMGRLLGGATTAGADQPSDLWRPPADVEETAEAFVIEIELPSVKREDVSVEVSSGEVVVTGDIKEKERVGLLRTRTRRTGRFEYRLSLPGEVDADNVTASLSEGVLTVQVPKSEHAKRRIVPVTRQALPRKHDQ